MPAVLIILNVIFTVLQQVGRKEYNRRNDKGAYTFSFGGVFITLIYFLIASGGRPSLPSDGIWYVLPFSLGYTLAYFFTMKSIETGPLSLTSLVISYSLIIPTIYGIAALSEPIGVTLIIGIILLFVSMTLIECSGKASEKRISLRWTVYVTITFLSNGLCTTVQKLFQTRYQGEYSNGFMAISLTVTVAVLGLMVLLRERKIAVNAFKKGFIWFSLCGMGNGLANYLTLILAVSMPASVLYPILSGGGILLTAAVAIIFYKEKLSVYQKIGLFLGVGAVVVLNL